MQYNKKRSDQIKISKDNSSIPINSYKYSSRDEGYNQSETSPAEKKTPYFSEFFQLSTDVKEATDLTCGGSIKSVI